VADDHASLPAIIGLTGGIGSGKSSVASIFLMLEVPVLDLDRVGEQIIDSSPDILPALVQAFGYEILDGDMLNRKRLAEICFSSRDKTELLNSILHPLIWQEMDSWVKKQKQTYVIVEASVLIESGGCDRMDATVVVMAELPARRQRVVSRGDQTGAVFDNIVKLQCSDDERRSHADFTIYNDSNVESLELDVKALNGLLIKQFGS